MNQEFRNKAYSIFNYLASGLLVFSFICVYIAPSNFWIAPFISICYPFLVLLNLFFVIFWAFKKRWHFLISLISILITYPVLLNTFSLGKIKQVFVSPKEHASSTELKIMSWNVRLFDLYNWSHNTETKAKMFELLENEQADIICFQEFFYQKEVDKGQVNIFNTRDTLKNILNAKYCHDEYTDTVLKRHFFGAATFSKYPIVNTGKIFFGDVPNNLCLFTDVLIKKDTVRIYNMHLASIRLKNKDYKFIEEIKNNDTTNTDFATGSKSIVKQMKMAYLKRVEQSKQVLDHINQCTYPVILCGDFNDPPFSYTYQKMRVKLHDSFTDAGFGLGATHTIILPVFRIDDILSDDHFTTKDFRVIRKKYSDHYPVTARLYYKTVEPKQ